jgi:hypothetical protein
VSAETIWIESTSGPDHKPVCHLTWGHVACYPPVAAVRLTAIDLVTCAAYAEMMMKLVNLGLPPAQVSAFASDLLSDSERRRFGDPSTLSLLPAGSSKRKEALVLLTRGSMKGALSPDEARAMALRWLEAAEATESDQLVSEALRATGTADAEQAGKLFGYLRELRATESGIPPTTATGD